MELNDVESSINAWGKISVSEVDLLPNKGQFKVSFNQDLSNYVQAARSNISSDASSSQQSALYLGLLLQGVFTPSIVAGSSPGSTNLPSQLSIPNQAQTAVNGFSPAATLSGLAPITDERDAVDKGINDKIAEMLLEFMANPTSGSSRQAVVFGVMQATCEPGQFTRKGYIAELDVSLKYAHETNLLVFNVNTNVAKTNITYGIDSETGMVISITNATYGITNSIIGESSKRYYIVGTHHINQVDLISHPGVLAVLPLMDSRNVELRNSNQNQIELALALSAAFAAKGINAAANSLSDYVNRQQSNIDTRNSLPVATTYTDGPNFGFQLYPSMEAVESPGKASGTPAAVLEAVTFPVVVAILIDKDDLTRDSDQNANAVTQLVFETQTRWIPIKKPWLIGTRLGDGWPLVERLKRAREIDMAQSTLDDLYSEGFEYPRSTPKEYQQQFRQLQIALDSLKVSALSYVSTRSLPEFGELFPKDASDTNAPGIIDVIPHSIWRDTNTEFTILVKGATNASNIAKVIMDGVECTSFQAMAFGKNNDAVKQSPFEAQGLAIAATFPESFYSITNNTTNNVEFVVLFKDHGEAPAVKSVPMTLQGKSSPEAVATINRDSNGKVLGIGVKPGQNLTDQQFLDAVKDILEKSESPPKTTNIIP